MNLNKVILIGRLTKDPETKTIPSGHMVCSFGLATNRVWTDRQTNQKQEKAEFHNIVLWRKLAEIASQYLRKGSLVLIEGRIQTRSWEDQTGNRKYRTEIIAENIQLAPRSLSPNLSPIKQNPPQSQKEQTPTPNVGSEGREDIPIIEEERHEEKDQDKEIRVEDIPL